MLFEPLEQPARANRRADATVNSGPELACTIRPGRRRTHAASRRDEFSSHGWFFSKLLKPYRNVFFDLANEHNAGNTALSLTQIRQLEDVVFGEDATRVVTVSTTGDANQQHLRFSPLLNDGTIDFAAPHFKRTTDWANQTGTRINTLRSNIAG